MSVLVLADLDNTQLSPATARVVGAAAQLGAVDLLVLDPAATSAASALQGVAKVISAAVPLEAKAIAALLESLAPHYDYIVASASSVGKDVMPRLAAKLDIQPVTDIIAIEGASCFVRPVYAGNALETVSDSQAKHVLTVRASAFRPVAGTGSAPVETLSSTVPAAARLIAQHRTESDVPDLSTAQVVVGGGVSVGSAEGFKLIENLGAVLGAAVGATRAAVDAGYAPNDWQVGQTGKIIAPDIYIAVGISGALQHLAGIQGAKKIIAINKDPEAPIVKIADVALIGDLFEIVPQLTAELQNLGVSRRG
ncbi:MULTISPECIES: electron transfer flavoprotein subunit alpha/FixB family protein [unclassified Devosia]|uniref:electron transfer flavoprotein subunit alpha/FixB family protein n=1 Tax=unclassified Devosia TaxID=196773 RepID=UPI00145F1903|nr:MULTISPECIES: electron transfer flavoprotein subunit alpha/FixB family protein [unclassified Devosia]MBJ6989057.1 electron transfer flavoprotein subunit alpha/FixB family protein [Devosia sp. MC521]QMW63141.1 electron transfer flavoprotein subunit alpha/FixB family protein [Devosia sp. MC521]